MVIEMVSIRGEVDLVAATFVRLKTLVVMCRLEWVDEEGNAAAFLVVAV